VVGPFSIRTLELVKLFDGWCPARGADRNRQHGET
jgi:hypothetical protein